MRSFLLNQFRKFGGRTDSFVERFHFEDSVPSTHLAIWVRARWRATKHPGGPGRGPPSSHLGVSQQLFLLPQDPSPLVNFRQLFFCPQPAALSRQRRFLFIHPDTHEDSCPWLRSASPDPPPPPSSRGPPMSLCMPTPHPIEPTIQQLNLRSPAPLEGTIDHTDSLGNAGRYVYASHRSKRKKHAVASIEPRRFSPFSFSDFFEPLRFHKVRCPGLTMVNEVTQAPDSPFLFSPKNS